MKELEMKLKELKENNICVADLEILDEINYQSEYYLEVELNEEDKEMIFSQIHNAWLKSEGLPIHVITTAAMENFDKLKNMTTWDLVEEASWRY